MLAVIAIRAIALIEPQQYDCTWCQRIFSKLRVIYHPTLPLVRGEESRPVVLATSSGVASGHLTERKRYSAIHDQHNDQTIDYGYRSAMTES